MSEKQACPRCGVQLPPDTPPDSCPRCLMSMGVAGGAGEHVPTVTPHPGHGEPAPKPSELAPHFPQLEILEVLGRGGMGVVYKATQKGLDRPVALKILTLSAEAGAGFAQRFVREAKALASLDHSNIVTVHDFGEAGGYYYLLMEFIEGDNLREAIRSRKLLPSRALAIVSQICEALQFAHDHGIVHRDIKPENILIDREGQVKIADFGLAKILGLAPDERRLTGSRQAMGTAHYMAPEQIEHPRDVDHRADIFSLGVVFYELLTGELPLGRFDPPSHKIQLDVRVDDVVLKTLEKEPRRRYQHANEVKTDVDTICGTPGPPPSSPPLPIDADPERGISPGRLRLAGSTAIADALLLLPISILALFSWMALGVQGTGPTLIILSFILTALFLVVFDALRRMLDERFGFRMLNPIIYGLMATHVVWFLSDTVSAVFPDTFLLGAGVTVIVYLALGVGFIALGVVLLQIKDTSETLWKPLSVVAIVTGALTMSIILLLFATIAYMIFDIILAIIFFRVANRIATRVASRKTATA